MAGDPCQELPRAKRNRLIFRAVLHSLLTTTVLMVLYYLLPLDRPRSTGTAARLPAPDPDPARLADAGHLGRSPFARCRPSLAATEQPDLGASVDSAPDCRQRADRRVFARLTSASLLVLAAFGDRVAGGGRR